MTRETGRRDSIPREVSRYLRHVITEFHRSGEPMQQLADALGVSRTQLINIKDGERKPGGGLESAYAAQHFGGSRDELLEAAKAWAKDNPEFWQEWPGWGDAAAEAATRWPAWAIYIKGAGRLAIEDRPPTEPIDAKFVRALAVYFRRTATDEEKRRLERDEAPGRETRDSVTIPIKPV